MWFPALTVSIKELLCLSASKDKWPPSPPLKKLSELQFYAETRVSYAAAFKDCGKIVTVLTYLQATSHPILASDPLFLPQHDPLLIISDFRIHIDDS